MMQQTTVEPADTMIRVETKDRVLRVSLERPEKKNALNLEMYRALINAIHQANDDPQIHVVFLQGSDTVFSSGKDLGDFSKVKKGFRPPEGLQLLKAFSESRKPIVAAVAGPALGLGTTILLHCDLVFAADNAVFRLPFVNYGLTPEGGATYLLPLLMGVHRASELLMLGESFNAEKACRFGLVNEVWPVSELADRAWAVAEKLAAQPPNALQITKQLIRKTSAAILANTIAEELACLDRQLLSKEGKAIFSGNRPGKE